MKDLIGAGMSAGAGFNVNDRQVIMPEISWVRSSGASQVPGGASAHSDTYRVGLVATISYRGTDSTSPTRSIAIGLWYFQEDGSVTAAPAADDSGGRFVTRGCQLGAGVGLRRPTLLGFK